MYTAKIENVDGQMFVLTGIEPIYQIVSIVGLNPPNAQINTTTLVGLDGAVYNSSKLQTRNIVITLKINGAVEENRLNLYNYFRTKEWCRFYYKTETRDVYIDGYVESLECDLFSNSETAQISILCPSPFFRSVEQLITDVSNVVKLFTFPFSIEYNEPIPFSSLDPTAVTDVVNDSSTETGFIVECDFSIAVNKIVIRNTQTGEQIEVDYAFQDGDRLTIDTIKGEKSVRLRRGGVTTNLFSKVKAGSTFFQLRSGDNYFAYLADDGENNIGVGVMFSFQKMYRGV